MRNAPPPERYALYGNLQILPRPTAYPIQAKRKEAREPHDSLSAITTEPQIGNFKLPKSAESPNKLVENCLAS